VSDSRKAPEGERRPDRWFRSLFATGLVAGGTLLGVAIALLSISPTVEGFMTKLDLSGPLIGALGKGGWELLGVAFFVLMGVLLFRTAKKPMQV